MTRIAHDYHTHSTYSDGSFLWSMVGAAADAGLEGIGITDHCNVSDSDDHRRRKKVMGFNLDSTYERRREGIEEIRDQFDIDVYDAVELDYEPDDEAAIRAFLDEAAFDYAVGSVHYLDGVNVHFGSYYADMPREERRALVDRYFEKLVALVESELFEIAAHPDLFERTAEFRGLASDDHYHEVAEAFRSSRTVPELNAGRALDDYGEFHPAPRFVEVLLEHDVAFTVGTDSHEPEAIGPRVEAIAEQFERYGIEPVQVV
ncbi:PHP domain-containing protein [Haloglomus litoreum]|uniref:PHP domain-containing protein n=1 Tax=Haloglomus litoreum TaxID=3034026 RepID=UPI0023E79958|nr:PHP domain-containing protein [Haloglomus sp. DT116]